MSIIYASPKFYILVDLLERLATDYPQIILNKIKSYVIIRKQTLRVMHIQKLIDTINATISKEMSILPELQPSDINISIFYGEKAKQQARIGERAKDKSILQQLFKSTPIKAGIGFMGCKYDQTIYKAPFTDISLSTDIPRRMVFDIVGLDIERIMSRLYKRDQNETDNS